MNIIIFGATGVIGSECVQQAIQDKNIIRITIITRRSSNTNINSNKVHVIIHTNFLDYSTLTDLFQTHQACIWALGVSQNAVNENEYINITHDFTLAAANAISSVNPDMRFIFISGMGADSNEQSRFMFSRIKGKTENDLIKQTNLKEIYTLRPGAVLSPKITINKPWYERAFQPLLNIFKLVRPSWIIDSIVLARAILFLAKNGHHATLFENQDIKDIVSQNQLVE